MHDETRRRTYSAPVRKGREGDKRAGVVPANVRKEDKVARSGRTLFDGAAVSPRGHSKSSRPTAPDPSTDCKRWLLHWAKERSITWATDYFAARDWTLSDFALPKWGEDEGAVQLGSGGDGVVWFAVEREHKVPCALKELYSDSEREILIHATLEHPLLTRFYTNFYDEIRGSYFIVLEFCAGGSLYDVLPDEGGVTESVAAYTVRQVLESLNYLHGLGVVYADLKTTNIMLDAEGHLKLTDFGASHWAAGDRKLLRNVTGTVDMQPPEMMSEAPGFNKQVDNWSLGVLAYRLLVGDYPFSFDDDDDVIRKNILALSYAIPANISALGKQVISGLLKTDPSDRLSLAAVRDHDWQQGVQLPELFAERAFLEVEAYHTYLNFDDLKAPEPIDKSLLARTLRFCNVPVTKQNFFLSLVLVYLLGCVTGVHLEKASQLGAFYYV